MGPLIAAAIRILAGAGGRAAAGRTVAGAFGRTEAAAAKASIAGRGQTLRNAMQAAGGDKGLAREMMAQQDQQIKEEARQAKKMENAEAPSLMDRITKGGQILGDAAVGGINQQTRIMQDNYRGAAVSALNQTGPLGATAGKLVDAMGKLTDAIVEKGIALSPFSGELAASAGMANVRQIMANLTEAQRNGTAYARVIDEQSKLQTDLQDAFNPAKEEIAKAIGDILEFLNDNKDVFHAIALMAADQLRLIRLMMEAGMATMPLLSAAAKLYLSTRDDDIKKADAAKKKAAEEMLNAFNHPDLRLPGGGPARPPTDMQPMFPELADLD